MGNLQHIENAARRKANASEDWQGYHFEVVIGGYLVIGSAPVGHYKSGPRKGTPKWEGEGITVVVTEDDVAIETSLYVKTTGNCPNCFGKKTELVSWSKREGTKTQPCRACTGSGLAQAELPAPAVSPDVQKEKA